MSGKPIPEEAVAQVCDRMLTAAIGKDWRKRAPEAVTAFWMGEVREALQEVVPALTAAQQQGQAVACVCCEDKPAPGNNPCGWCGHTAPPSAPVGVEVFTVDGLGRDRKEDWTALARLAGRYGIRYRTNAGMVCFLRAALAQQGGSENG